ncbi:MAG: nitroreductase/quinone reductase family protein [Rudaea sp.]
MKGLAPEGAEMRPSAAEQSEQSVANPAGKIIGSFFFITFVVANLGLVLYGALALIMPGILLQPFSEYVYQFPSDATKAAAYLAALFRLVGFFNTILGMLGLLFLWRLALSRQVWIRRLVIGSTMLAYLGPIVFDNTVGHIGFFEIVEHVIFGLVIFLGIVNWRNRIPANDTVNRFASTYTGVWAIKHIVSPLQRVIYRGTGGRLLSTIGSGRNVLLLTTKGRRTGRERTTPVFYLRDGRSIVICNVNPGFEHTNPWVINLRADRLARIQIGRKSGFYRAREATAAELARFWPQFITVWPTYQSHYERSGRRVIFILEPAAEAKSAV